LICGISATLILALAFSPLSLRGVIANHIVLGIACIMLLLSLGTVSRLARWFMAVTITVIIGIAILRNGTVGFASAFALILDLSDALPSCEIDLGSGRIVRLYRYGWFAHGGTDVVVAARWRSIPLEYELGRKQFSDETYNSSAISAKLIIEQSKHKAVLITYDGQEIWRVPAHR